MLEKDGSSIAVLEATGMSRPKELDGKRYASYGARFEDSIVRDMVKNDAGTGQLEIVHPRKPGLWDTILKGEADATWIFDAWEGVQARCRVRISRRSRWKNSECRMAIRP